MDRDMKDLRLGQNATPSKSVFSVTENTLYYKGTEILLYDPSTAQVTLSLHGYNSPQLLRKINDCFKYLSQQPILLKKRKAAVVLVVDDTTVMTIQEHWVIEFIFYPELSIKRIIDDYSELDINLNARVSTASLLEGVL